MTQCITEVFIPVLHSSKMTSIAVGFSFKGSIAHCVTQCIIICSWCGVVRSRALSCAHQSGKGTALSTVPVGLGRKHNHTAPVLALSYMYDV